VLTPRRELQPAKFIRRSKIGIGKYVVLSLSMAADTVTDAHGTKMDDATVRLSRRWTGYWLKRAWTIAIDGTAVGSLANNETVEVSVEPGHHPAARVRQAPES